MLKIHCVCDVFMREMLKNIVFFYVFGGRSGCGRGANKQTTKCPVDRGAGKMVVPALQAWALRARSSEDP